MAISENIEGVRARIRKCAEQTGRTEADICLVAVSKTVEVPRIQQAVDAGLLHLGENRVQEMTEKMPQLPQDVHWHMIGTLQKNKVKYIIGKTELIHSLCSIEVAKEIQRLSERENVYTNCLIQINIGNEATKSGIDAQQLPQFLQEISAFDRIIIKGLMAIAPIAAQPEDSRPYFAHMKRLYDALPETAQVQKQWLSMGMTGDFEAAILEGANMVRVGSGIFGERVYH